MQNAWSAYKKYAWGYDELRPMDRSGTNNLGRQSLGLTVIDSLDTLLIMGMNDEFAEARDYVLKELTFDQDISVSMFEANIRIVGGLLAAFGLCGETGFLSKAYDMANRFLPAFRTTIPINDVNLME